MKKQMQNLIGICLALTLSVSAASAAGVTKKSTKKAEPVMTEPSITYQLDTKESKATWVGKKVASSHTGTVKFKEGHFDLKGRKMTGGEVVIDLTTLQNQDVTDAGYKKKLEDHLKGEDFFHTEKHPTATFKIEELERMTSFAPGHPNAIARGKLTIRGKTKPHEVKLFYTPNEDGFEAKGKMEINRTDFGLKYNSQKFFSAKKLGDKLIKDNFEVDLDLVAKQKL